MSLLTLKDFEGKEFNPELSPFDILVEVSTVALKKFKQEKFPKKERCNGKKFKNSAIESLRKNTLQRNCLMFEKKKNVKKGKKSKALKKIVPTGSPYSPTEALPEEFKKKIESLGGTKVGWVIEKYLTPTDLSQSGNRMSMPVNQIRSNFLEDDEIEMLESGATLTVTLIEPSLEPGPICLRQWNMDKAQGKKSSKMYVLRTQWGEVARRNGLKNSDLIQVWSFRANKGKLHLALVLVKRVEKQNSDGNGGSGCKSSVVDGENGVEERRGNYGFEDHPSTTCQSSCRRVRIEAVDI